MPDATPGSARWNGRADVVGRAMRLIADGVVDRSGVQGLADALGYSERHLRRLLIAEVGAGPLELARCQRAQTARVLVETTDLPLSRVAFAAGYGSIRAFNDAMQETFSTAPQRLRTRARARAVRTGGDRSAATTGGSTGLHLRLAYRAPADLAASSAFLAARAVTGVEEVRDGVYRRTLRLPHGHGVVSLDPGMGSGRPDGTAATDGTGFVHCHLRLTDLRDLQTAVRRCRLLLDLDADPAAVEEHLTGDPILGATVRAHPGRRMVGAVDGAEAATRVVLGQQVSVAAARTQAGALVRRLGSALQIPDDTLTHLFPDAARLAAVDPSSLPLPGRRARALVAVNAAVLEDLHGLGPGVDADVVDAVLAGIRGVGPWTRALVRMRVLADPDVLPLTDLGVRRGLDALGSGPVDARRRSAGWRPWRSYATHHLWAAAAAPTDDTGSAAA